MQSTKKGALTKREDGVPPVGMATGGPLVGDEPPSTAAAPPTPTALQPSVSEGSSLSFLALCSLFSSCWRKDALEHHCTHLETRHVAEANGNTNSLTAKKSQLSDDWMTIHG